MNTRFKRFGISLTCPPIFAAFLISCYFLALEISRSTPWFKNLDDVLVSFLFMVIYGFLFCIGPSIIYWLICELIWSLKWHVLKTRFVFTFIGAALGLLAGFAIVAFMKSPNVGPIEMSLMCTSGAIAGFATSWIIHSQHDKIA